MGELVHSTKTAVFKMRKRIMICGSNEGQEGYVNK